MAMADKERTLIRDLATQVAEICALPRQAETIDLWKRHNRLEHTRPPVLLYDGTGHETGGRYELACADQFARGQEADMRGRLHNWEHMRDDSVWEPYVECHIAQQICGYGIAGDADAPDHVFGAKHFNQVIADDADPAQIPMPDEKVDWEETDRRFQQLAKLYDGILTVRKQGVWVHWYAPIDALITLRGIEQTMMDMIDRPQWLHGWLQRLLDFHLEQLDQWERLNVLTLNNRYHWCGSGGSGYSDQLPQPDFDGVHVRAKDQWGHAATQIFSEVSPAMHEEFCLRYSSRFLARFGLKCYGCCEPLHNKVDVILKHIPDLRRLSMSPWVDVARGAAALGDRAIFSYKPNPAILGMEHWDVAIVREQLREVFDITRRCGCIVEVVMKDLHTVRGDVTRMWDWIDMATKLSEEYA